MRSFMQRYNVIICPWFANFAANFVDFIHYQFCTLHRSPKTCIWLAERFRTFHPSLNESVTEKRDVLKKKIFLCHCVNAWPLVGRVTINVFLQGCYALSYNLLSAACPTRLNPKHPLYVNTRLFCKLFVWWFSSFVQVFIELCFSIIFKTHPH